MKENNIIEKQFTCLLVDDDTDDQEILMSVLKEFIPDALCITATDGEEALTILRDRNIKPSIIFADLNMPRMNGKQFLKECRQLEICKKIPVIILTTTSDRKSIEETMRLGATDYITKPDRFSRWGEVIREKLKPFYIAEGFSQ